jgi:hypothetical protein
MTRDQLGRKSQVSTALLDWSRQMTWMKVVRRETGNAFRSCIVLRLNLVRP